MRILEERDELLNNLKNKYATKSTKEKWLRELRQLERQMGIEGKNYNSNEF